MGTSMYGRIESLKRIERKRRIASGGKFCRANLGSILSRVREEE
jgi:hypothetical protein